MTAADILRERARLSEERVAGYGILSPAELRAIADLLEVGPAAQQLLRDFLDDIGGCDHDVGICICADTLTLEQFTTALAALERLIEGERDADR